MISWLPRSRGRELLKQAVTPLSSTTFGRSFASGNGDKKFQPRRRPDRKYRPQSPIVKKTQKQMKLDSKANKNNPLYSSGNPVVVQLDPSRPAPSSDDLDATYGDIGADIIRDIRRKNARRARGEVFDEVEEELRMADYLTAETGSTEDLVFGRRALARDIPDAVERKAFVEDLEKLIEKQQQEELFGEIQMEDKLSARQDDTTDSDDEDEDNGLGDEEPDPETMLDKNQLAHGEWSEMLVTVDRTNKLWRGGRLESYRALVIGGNLNGCGGFGIGKSGDPIAAVTHASRKCKKNIFFVERYQGKGLTSDLAGKQNSCKVYLRSTNNGLRGHNLVSEILKRFGITNCVSKSHGNRNPYNVVRATFKALLTHESLEDIALKRGKRLVSIDRAMRMQV